MTQPFDIVVTPVASLFAKRLQAELKKHVKNLIFRRSAPKQIGARRTIISRKGNILRRGREATIRQNFSVTVHPLNKVEQFNAFTTHNITCPKHTTRTDLVGELGTTVFARTLINSTNGRGIIEFKPGVGDTPQAPLYTEYIPKKAEYRFHVFAGEVIDIQQKKKKSGVDENERNTRIRNVHNGYVYCRDGINAPDGAADLAIRAVAACGYQYGAVDVIYNEKRNQSYVLEVNSRPGLMGTTLEKYAEAIINTFNLTRK